MTIAEQVATEHALSTAIWQLAVIAYGVDCQAVVAESLAEVRAQ